MSINLDDMLKRLPKARRDKIGQRTQEFLTEYSSLQELRWHGQEELRGI
jgi:hypothetical protein